MNASDRIKKSHVAIMRHKTFCAYSGILACGKVEMSRDIPTARTNGWDRTYNPDFVDELTDAELNFLVLHEATHVAYSHLRVWRDLWDINPRMTNIAADHFVNLSIQDTDAGAGFATMPKEGVQPEPKYRGWSVKQIFDDLMKQAEQQQQAQGGEGGGDNPDDPDEGSGFDQHDWKNAGTQTPEEAGAQAEEIQRALRQGEIVRRKRAGTGSGGADAPFGDLLSPKVDWRKVLRDFLTETCAGRDESSWRKPNRRYLGEGIYMPSMVGTTVTELVVGFDTSGSIFGGVEMTRFVSELSTIVNDIKPQKCRVVYWDTAVLGEQVFEDGQFAVQSLKPKGGGGTDASVLFDYIRTNNINPQAIINFTDGYVGDWGRSSTPTLWAITSSTRSPWGTTIQLEV
jgi:predicted metal-dependent peptidase